MAFSSVLSFGSGLKLGKMAKWLIWEAAQPNWKVTTNGDK